MIELNDELYGRKLRGGPPLGTRQIRLGLGQEAVDLAKVGITPDLDTFDPP